MRDVQFYDKAKVDALLSEKATVEDAKNVMREAVRNLKPDESTIAEIIEALQRI